MTDGAREPQDDRLLVAAAEGKMLRGRRQEALPKRLDPVADSTAKAQGAMIYLLTHRNWTVYGRKSLTAGRWAKEFKFADTNAR